MKTVLLSIELLDLYKEGKKTFSDITLQYVDLSDTNLKDIVIKNSKLFFATFRNCNFQNAKFINCEIIYGSFYGGNLEGVTFDNCTIDMTLFQRIITKNMKILRSKLIWSAILDSAIGEVDLSSSTQFKFFTSLSQLTEKDLEDAMIHINPLIDSLDISIKHKINQEMKRDAQAMGINIPKETEKTGYSESKNDSPGFAYSMQALADSVINAYNTANPYKSKSKTIYDKNTTKYSN